MNKGLILDRDGVIIEDVGFPHKISQLKFCEGSIEALHLACSLGYKIVVVTNQSGIARGLFSIRDYKLFQDYLITQLLEKGIRISNTYFCPHLPEGWVEEYSMDCNCRKPKPGMIQAALKDFNLDPKESLVVGDRISDVVAGMRAGVHNNFIITNNSNFAIERLRDTVDFDYKFFKGSYRNLGELAQSEFLIR
jgi:D,D-heptose 1,7-bisphosphate phosphatase